MKPENEKSPAPKNNPAESTEEKPSPLDIPPSSEDEVAGSTTNEEKAVPPKLATEIVEPEETTPEPSPIELLEAELAAIKDKFLRQAADMENLRRRTEREKQDMAKFAISNFAKDIVTLDDNLARTLSSVPEDANDNDPALKALVEGVEMTSRELTNVLERYGIKRIDPKGDIFDPNLHQALFEIPNPEIPAGTILEVVAPGFMIESRILRPAMVGIAKGGEKPKKTPKTEDKPETQSSENKDDNVKVDRAV